MSTTQNFQLNTGDVLGFNYRSFISSQKAIAISDPKTYYQQRNDLMQDLKVTIIEKMYENLFNVLTIGKPPAGGKSSQLATKPCYPPQKINDLLINLCSDLAENLEEVVELVFPSDFEKIADSRLLIKTRGESVNVGGGAAP